MHARAPGARRPRAPTSSARTTTTGLDIVLRRSASRRCRRCCASSGGADRRAHRGLDRVTRWEGAHRRRAASAHDLPEHRPGCGSRDPRPDGRRRSWPCAHGAVGAAQPAGRPRPSSRTRSRPCSTGAGPTACPSCPRPKPGSCACSRARRTRADEVVAVVPPDLVECTVEKVAINAVLAGCQPEYLPVVLAAVEAACTDEFNAHGLLATTMPVGPVLDRERADPPPHRHELGRATPSARATGPTPPSGGRCSS